MLCSSYSIQAPRKAGRQKPAKCRSITVRHKPVNCRPGGLETVAHRIAAGWSCLCILRVAAAGVIELI
jgi:hypothetical protein